MSSNKKKKHCVSRFNSLYQASIICYVLIISGMRLAFLYVIKLLTMYLKGLPLYTDKKTVKMIWTLYSDY